MNAGAAGYDYQILVEGSAAHSLESVQHTAVHIPEKTVSARTLENREKALQMNFGYVMFLTAAAVISVAICVNYLKLQASYTRVQQDVTKLEAELSGLELEYAVQKNRIYSSVNLEDIKKDAVNRLGMDYPTEDQIVLYDAGTSDYVIQYQNIP